MKSGSHLLLGIGIIIVLVATFTAVHGQGVTTPGTRGRTDPVQRELQRRFESEAIERALAASPRRLAEHERRMILAQIREDFLRIQIVDHDLQKSAPRTGPLDLKVVARFASEITKRAERLKDNLVLPEIERASEVPGSKAETGIEPLRLSLSVLSNAINSFVENPVFEKFRLVDAKLSAQARRDLEQIIVVSKQVKRSSEQLQRARPRATWASPESRAIPAFPGANELRQPAISEDAQRRQVMCSPYRLLRGLRHNSNP